jgi:hypothetical protein
MFAQAVFKKILAVVCSEVAVIFSKYGQDCCDDLATLMNSSHVGVEANPLF